MGRGSDSQFQQSLSREVTLAIGCSLAHVKVLGFRRWMSFPKDINCSVVDKKSISG